MAKPKLRQVRVEGKLAKGVYAKDVILAIINILGVKGGVATPTSTRATPSTACPWKSASPSATCPSREARASATSIRREDGGVSPRPALCSRGRGLRPGGHVVEVGGDGAGASFDDVEAHRRRVSRAGGNLGHQSGNVGGREQDDPSPDAQPEAERPTFREALAHMGFSPASPSRAPRSTWPSWARAPTGACPICASPPRWPRRARWPRACARSSCPAPAGGKDAEAEGLHEIFKAAGFEWRKAGCSMCLGMNPDQLVGREMSASSSNRNFIGRQGSPTGRTLLMSPAMVAAAAITGVVTDVREILK